MTLVSVYAIISGIGFGIILDGRPGTGFQPVFAGILLGVSSVCLLVRTIKDGNKKYIEIQADPEKFAEEEKAHLFKEQEEATYRRDTETWLGKAAAKIIPNAKLRWALAYLVGIWILIIIIDKLGMYFGIWLLNFLFLKFISKFSWLRSLVYSVAIALAFYVVFTLILNVTTPKFLNCFR